MGVVERKDISDDDQRMLYSERVPLRKVQRPKVHQRCSICANCSEEALPLPTVAQTLPLGEACTAYLMGCPSGPGVSFFAASLGELVAPNEVLFRRPSRRPPVQLDPCHAYIASVLQGKVLP